MYYFTWKLKLVSNISNCSSKFTTDKFYVMNTNARNLLTSFCKITLNLLTFNMQSKVHPFETSSKCEINLPTHESKYGNLCSKVSLADFKTQQEDNIPKRLIKLVQTYHQSLFTRKIGKLKDTKIKLHINKSIPTVAQAKGISHFLWENQFVQK